MERRGEVLTVPTCGSGGSSGTCWGRKRQGISGTFEGRAPELRLFTCDHVLNGTVDAQGQDPADRWQLIVRDNEVTRRDAKPLEFEDEVPV